VRIYGPGDLPAESPTVRLLTNVADEIEQGHPLTPFSRDVVLKALDLAAAYVRSKNL
jgi:hypothetical protein